MPIRPENKKLYPKNWPAIRSKVLARAASCEFCDVKNYSKGYRDINGIFYEIFTETQSKSVTQRGYKIVKIVLTIAHLDHDPTNNDLENLRALCQRCHNKYDAAHRAFNRKKNKAAGL